MHILILLLSVTLVYPLLINHETVNRDKVDNFLNYSKPLEFQWFKGSNASNHHDFLYAGIDKWMDKLINKSDDMLRLNGYDPYDLPDYHNETTVYIFWMIPYTGSYDMFQGVMKGASNIFRGGNSSATYYNTSTKFLNLNVPIGFKELKFSYEYSVIFDSYIFYSEGTAEGSVKNLLMNFGVGIDLETGLFSLDDFTIIDSGYMTLNLYTKSYFPNWILNMIINTFTPLIKSYVLSYVEQVGRIFLAYSLDETNVIVRAVLDE